MGTAPGEWGGYSNGKIPADQLAVISWAPAEELRPDALQGLIAMNVAFRASFGHDLPSNNRYCSYEEQLEAKVIHEALHRKFHGITKPA